MSSLHVTNRIIQHLNAFSRFQSLSVDLSKVRKFKLFIERYFKLKSSISKTYVEFSWKWQCRALPCGPALKDPSKLMVDFRCLSYL